MCQADCSRIWQGSKPDLLGTAPPPEVTATIAKIAHCNRKNRFSRSK